MSEGNAFIQTGNSYTPLGTISVSSGDWTWLSAGISASSDVHKPVRIVSIDNKTIKCVFKDKKEVFVTVQEEDIFDERVGTAIAIVTHLFGSKTKFFDYVAEIIERPVRTEKKTEKKKKVKKV
jgi:hypothetical protein